MDIPEFNQQNANPTGVPGQKRTYSQFMMSQQLTHRFKAKSDFITYFSESRKFVHFLNTVPSSLALRAPANHDQQGLPQGDLC
jgi:hypothetical protein